MCLCVAKPVAVELRCHATALILHFFAFFCKNTSVPSVYVKTVTLDKLQKYNRIPNGAESGFLSYSFDTFCLLRTHVFCKASTELAKGNTVLVSEIFIVYFLCVK